MDEYDWELFGRLMERYDSIETVIAMMSQIKPNNRRLAGISEQLKAGGQFAETLNNSPLEKQLRFFLQFLSLAKALRVTLSYRRQGHHISKLLVSSLSYPLAVLMAGLAVLAVFEKVVLPSFGSTLELSITDSAGAVTVFRLIGIMRNGLIILILIAVILTLYVLISRRANYVWVFLHRLRLDGLIRKMATYQLASDLEVLLGAGVSLDSSLELIRRRDPQGWLSLLAFHLVKSLGEGDDFIMAIKGDFFDPQFCTIAMIGMSQGDFTGALGDYRMIMEQRLERDVKIGARAIEGFCYLFAALIILAAYQVLMLPMSLLEGL